MPLSCSCDFDPYADFTWFFESPDDYHPLYRRRAVRCASCRSLIRPGETATLFRRWRSPRSDIEIRIYGEEGEIPLAPMFHCETCADLFFSLGELGYECIAPDENMRELVQEYAALQDHPQLIRHTCPACNGNDREMACAYPGEGMAGCPREHRLAKEGFK